jgi:hypothetical protein
MCFSTSAGDCPAADAMPTVAANTNAVSNLVTCPPGTKNEERRTKNQNPEHEH